MNKLFAVSAIAISGLMFQTANAQVGLHFNINLGARPVVVERAPVYDDDYYYLPEVEAYYSVNQHCYYYQDGGRWLSGAYLPGRYHDYDWRTAARYEVREPRPYLHNDVYRGRYGGWEGRRDWNYRDERSTRVYADRERFDHDQYRRNDNYRDNQRYDDHKRFDNRSDRPQQSIDRGNYNGRGPQQQPQQNDNHGNYGGGQPQQNDNHGNYGGGRQQQPQNNSGDHGSRGNNNGGGQNNWQHSGRS